MTEVISSCLCLSFIMNSTMRLEITIPSGERPLIEYQRDFDVQGKIIHAGILPDDLILTICLYDDEGRLLRQVHQDHKNSKDIWAYHPGMTAYKESLDPGRKKMIEFGFPELQVRDTNDPEASIHDASIKCFYNDELFKAIIVSGSDVEHGRVFDTMMDYRDSNGEPYDRLEKGEYRLEVILSDNKGQLLCKTEKTIIIGIRDRHSIIRFNPVEHKQNMIRWCNEIGILPAIDTIPGYLEPYLGKWYYHMGLLPYYRSNDIAMYTFAKVYMFVYLIDPTSTSYETELAYLQHEHKVSDPKWFSAYRYDIGEAILGRGRAYERKGKIVELKEDEPVIYRIDIVNEKAQENIFDLSEEAVEYIVYDHDEINIEAGTRIAISGAVRPRQFDPEDFILKKENVYEIRNEIDMIRYEIDDGSEKWIEDRKLLMRRIDKEDIGSSVFEFYNLFVIKDEDRGKTLKICMSAVDKKGNVCSTVKKLKITVL